MGFVLMAAHSRWWTAAYGAYFLLDLATFVFLTFFDGYRYTWWNWIVAVPVNFMLAAIWPIYWAIIRPLFG